MSTDELCPVAEQCAYAAWRLLQLPQDLVDRIIGFLPKNEVPCTLRLVNKAAAALFSTLEHGVTVQLSLPVPHHAFSRHWGSPQSINCLTVEKRRQLLCLTARSGSTDNLEFIAARVGCPLSEDAFAAAASSGHLDTCRWLRAHGCPLSSEVLEAAAEAGHLDIVQWLWGPNCPLSKEALIAAARNGHAAVCEWLLSCSCPWSNEAPAAAAHGGDLDLMYELLDEQPEDVDFEELLTSAAAGCDLTGMQNVTTTAKERQPDWQGRIPEPLTHAMLAAAASGSSPDWRAKTEWLAAQGGRAWLGMSHWRAIAHGTDPLGRLTWLLSSGWLVKGFREDEAAATAFARVGNTEAMRLVLHGPQHKAVLAAASAAAGATPAAVTPLPAPAVSAVAAPPAAPPRLLLDAASAAAASGHLPALQLLHAEAAGHIGMRQLEMQVLRLAARQGHLQIVQWIVEHSSPGVHLQASKEVFAAGAGSGRLEMMAWLRERGCDWDGDVFLASAGAGCETALEWLAERGCPMPDSGRPYVAAALRHDTATLRCLRRLGCPWGPPGDGGVMATLIDRAGASRQLRMLPHLRWLLAEGCPVNWAAARRALPDVGADELVAWVLAVQKRQRRRGIR